MNRIFFILPVLLGVVLFFQNCTESSLVLPDPVEEPKDVEDQAIEITLPEINALPSSVEIPEGSNLIIDLSLGQDAKFGTQTVDWFRNDVLYSRDLVLSFNSIVSGDYGFYHAIVKNEAGEVETEKFQIRQATEFDFGGMFTQGINTNYPNPLTQALSCPAGYQASNIAGGVRASGVKLDADTIYCFRPHNPNDKQNSLNFGGMFGISGGNVHNNPATGAQSCPPTFNQVQIRGGDAGIPDEGTAFLCYKNFVGNELSRFQFAGMSGGTIDRSVTPAVSQLINNEISGDTGCPAGYTRSTSLGANNIDFPINYCHRD